MSERMRIQRKRERVTTLSSAQSDTLKRSPLASMQDVDEVPSIVQEVLSSSGQPLDSDTRTFMEPRFGHDFSQIRVHTDEQAVESAQAVNALAYTVGQDVVFGEGQYAPETIEGKRLLAHELTHVVQQSERLIPDIQRAEAETASPTAAQPVDQATPAADAEIEALDLAPKAKAAAKKLKEQHPDIVFKSGRRTVAEQAHAMASNIVQSNNRKWIEQTYKSAAELQKWVDDNPAATTVDDIAKGLETTMNAMPEHDRAKVSKHLSGEAFDVQPQDKDSEAIKKDIQVLPGITKFLDKEGGLIRWHAQFKKPRHVSHSDDRFEQEADQMAEQIVNVESLPTRVGALEYSAKTIQRQAASAFTEEQFEPVRKVYEENAKKKSEDRDSCIVMVNKGLRKLFADQLKGKPLGSEMEKTMARLIALNLADQPIITEFLDTRSRITKGTLEPDTLSESVEAKLFAVAGSEPGWHLFGLSIMDGYHSVLLALDNRVPTAAKIYWMDQIYTGYLDVTNDLDDRITRLTKRWWNQVKAEKGVGYNTVVRIWPIIERLPGDFPDATSTLG